MNVAENKHQNLLQLENVPLTLKDIEHFLDEQAKRKIAFHSIDIRINNQNVMRTSWAPYSLEDTHLLYSLSKTFTAIAIGFAVQEGLLTVDEKITDIFSDLLSYRASEGMEQVTIHHLLSMNTGHATEPLMFQFEENLVQHFLESYIRYEPGTHFIYNTPATYVLSAILQAKSGQTLTAFLKSRLFEPLEMSRKIWSQQSKDGVDIGGSGLNVTLDDISKLGQFFLNRGTWNGEQVLDSAWIDRMMTVWSDNAATGGEGNWGMGYGYQMWKCDYNDAIRGDGMYGQLMVIVPSLNTVVSATAGMNDVAAELKLIYDCILDPIAKNLEEQFTASNVLEDDPIWERLNSLELNIDYLDDLDKALVIRGEGDSQEFVAKMHGRYELANFYHAMTYPQFKTIAISSGQEGEIVLDLIDNSDATSRLVLVQGAWQKMQLAPTVFSDNMQGFRYSQVEKLYRDIALRLHPSSDASRLCFDLVFYKSPASQRWIIETKADNCILISIQNMHGMMSVDYKGLAIKKELA